MGLCFELESIKMPRKATSCFITSHEFNTSNTKFSTKYLVGSSLFRHGICSNLKYPLMTRD